MRCARQIISGEMHYTRIPPGYWQLRLRMARAMGLTAISTYVFWNRHEPKPEAYDFSGENDVASYVRLAQEEGLDVILRPGPYVCAEWEFGGLPWWLLREPDLRVRTDDERFMAPVRRWLRRLGEELAPLQAANGGPIVAVQLENEYGAFGSDARYLSALRAALSDAGFASPLFTIDQPGDLEAGSLPDVPIAVTFAPGEPATPFSRLKALRPDASLLVGEYWAGWYDHWGEPHAQLDDAVQTADLEWMLSQGASVNIYMLHGGTNFAFWNGANADDKTPYAPSTTSYDYCAAIDEAGRPTQKYHAFREAIQSVTGIPAPSVPEAPPVVAIAPFELRPCAAIDTVLGEPVHALRPLSMESLEQAFGFVLYRTVLRERCDGELRVEGVHDYAIMYVNGRRIASFDRRLRESVGTAPLHCDAGATLDILVENCGRINYGKAFGADRKGIVGGVHLDGREVLEWDMYSVPLDNVTALRRAASVPGDAGFYEGTFEIENPADTFLDVGGLEKGVLWVNGRNIGRFWNIGPQRALYVPGVWLQSGANRVLAFTPFGAKGKALARGAIRAHGSDERPDLQGQ